VPHKALTLAIDQATALAAFYMLIPELFVGK
jgi:hypothetical protein